MTWTQQPLEKSPHSAKVRSLSESELNLIYKLLPMQTRISAHYRHKEEGDNLTLADIALHKRRPWAPCQPAGEAGLHGPVSLIRLGAGSTRSLRPCGAETSRAVTLPAGKRAALLRRCRARISILDGFAKNY